MSIIICATGLLDSGKSEFCNQLRIQEQGSIGFESSELITEIANEFNSYLSLTQYDSTNMPTFTGVVNEVLARLQNNHPQLLPEDATFTESEMQEQPEQFAELLKYASDIHAYPEILTQRINTENKDTYRPLLKWIGGYMVYKVSPSVWFDEINRRILRFQPAPQLITVNALRYPTDEKTMREFASINGHTCIVVETQRPGTYEGTDVTESSRSLIRSDTIVVNEGTVSDLSKTAGHILHDIKKNKLKPEYRSR